MAFTNARWVWVEQDAKPDTYGEFYDEFFWEKDEVECLISCDGDYTLFINGRWVSCNQYGDYEWYKSYDVVDITPYLKKGNNKMAVLVWHFGIQTQRSIKAQAGLIFEVKSKGKVLLSSGERTYARYSKAYKQGLQRKITKQLGLSFSYDSTKEDAWNSPSAVRTRPRYPHRFDGAGLRINRPFQDTLKTDKPLYPRGLLRYVLLLR